MSTPLERILPLVSFGILPWGFAVIYLLAGIIRSRMSKAKPELILVGMSFIVMIVVGVLAHSSGASTTNVRTGPITQQGDQNAAGVGRSVVQRSEPCDSSVQGKK